MSMLRRILSPKTMLVSAALVVATAGSAVAAGEIITSTDQIKDSVVTGPKLVDRSVGQRDESNPTLRYSVAANGSLITGDMGGNPQHVAGSGRYDLSFSSSDLGPLGLDTCAFVVQPRFRFTTSPGKNGHLNMRAYVNYARGANTFQVFTYEQRADGSEVPTDAAFDAVVSC
jgi:hypothetical protein